MNEGGVKMAGRNWRKNEKENYKINRFPIAMIVHYAMARKMYNEELAKALANASAVFYARAKQGWVKSHVKKVSKRAKNTEFQNPENYKICQLGKLGFKVDGNEVIFGKSRIKASDYDKALRNKLTDEERKVIEKYAMEYVKDIPHEDVYKAYEAVRDLWRTEEFWNELMKKYREAA
jgi:hypothetical protein